MKKVRSAETKRVRSSECGVRSKKDPGGGRPKTMKKKNRKEHRTPIGKDGEPQWS